MAYVTTNIRLETAVYERLKLKSARERKSLSQLIREAVAEKYGSRPGLSGRSPKAGRNPWAGLIGIGRSGVRDGAVNHDHYLYEVPKP
jgi:hypothetical protein